MTTACRRLSTTRSRSLRDDQAAFQYHVDWRWRCAIQWPPQAVQRALKGDLSDLTALESGIKADGTIAAGVKMISSVFSTSVKKEVSFKINLLGLLNVLSLSDLVRGSKVIEDPVTGDLTIADSVTGTADPGDCRTSQTAGKSEEGDVRIASGHRRVQGQRRSGSI